MKIARILLAILVLASLSAAVKPTLYLSNFKNNTLSVFDVSDPRNPVPIINPLTNGTSPFALMINPQGTALYVVNRNSANFSVFDLTDPQNPIFVKLVTLSNKPISIDTNAVGNALYVACDTSKTVFVFDISDPLNPVNVPPTLTFSSPVNSLTVNRAQNVLYIGMANADIAVYDISTPLSPAFSINVANTGNTDMRMMQVNPLGTALYVTNGTSNTISVFDLADPLSPFLVNSAIATNGTTALGIAMNFPLGLLYVTNRNSDNYSIFNITNALNPMLVSGFPQSSQGISPLGVQPYVQRNVFYIANSDKSGPNGTITVFNSNGVFIPPAVDVSFGDDTDEGPQDFALFVPRTPIPPAPEVIVLPPSEVRACTQEDRFLAQSELFAALSWNPSPSSIVVGYRIYRNGVLIATVPGDQRCYQDHCACGPTQYAVSAIDETGRESTKVVVQFCIN